MDPVTAILIIAASAIISIALAPKPPSPPAATLDDVSAPTAEEGRAIPVVFGTVWLRAPNVVWYGDLQQQAIRKSGGKK